MTFNYLALDGGGIRGYMTAKILMELEEHSGVNVIDPAHVHGYCGTSTGGLLSIALATGHSPEFLADLYKTRVSDIFESNDSKEFVWIVKMLSYLSSKFHALVSGPGIFDSQYRADGLVDVARELVGDKTFADIAQDRLLAVNTTSLDVPGSKFGWRAATFTNHPLRDVAPASAHDKLADTTGVSLFDGALSTSAAPSYFPPHRVKNGSTDLGFFADGGLFANNPVMNGYQIATGIMGKKRTDLRVISIGTGVKAQGIAPSAIPDPRDYGILDWFGAEKGVPAAAILNITMDCSADNMTELAHNILGRNIARVNPDLGDADIPLDATDKFGVMDEIAKKVVDTDAFKDAVRIAKAWAK